MDRDTPDKGGALSVSLARCLLRMNKAWASPEAASPSARERRPQWGNSTPHLKEPTWLPNPAAHWPVLPSRLFKMQCSNSNVFELPNNILKTDKELEGGHSCKQGPSAHLSSETSAWHLYKYLFKCSTANISRFANQMHLLLWSGG